MLLRSNFSSFPHYFIYIFLTSGVKLHIHLLNVVVQFIVFLTLSTLICRSTDISKCFSESLGIRDNGSRLYLSFSETGFSKTPEHAEWDQGYQARKIKKKTQKNQDTRMGSMVPRKNITKTCLYNFDPLKSHFHIVKLGFTGVYIIFLISAQNIECGYSLEPPRRCGSNEYP